MKRSQAALEFLTTYSWAFIVILIAIGALYYFGIFNFDTFLPQECVFSEQMECLDFAFVNDEIRFKLVNNLGENINITLIMVTNDAANSLTCTVPDSFLWNAEEEKDIVLTGCQDGAFIKGERAEATISLTYYSNLTPSKPLHTAKGRINALVN